MAKRARRTWLLVLIGIVALILVGGLIALRPNIMPLTWVVRTFAVLGYLCVFVAALSSVYIRELVGWFGRPFVNTHHIVTVAGLALLVLHPLAAAWSLGTLGVFVPQVSSWRAFFAWGGPVAWYLIGIGSLVALFRTRLRKQWRYLHWLNYPAFLLATTHAILLGNDFRVPAMMAIPIVLAVALLAVFVRKRLPTKRPSKRS